jgi:hypothetical protein
MPTRRYQEEPPMRAETTGDRNHLFRRKLIDRAIGVRTPETIAHFNHQNNQMPHFLQTRNIGRKHTRLLKNEEGCKHRNVAVKTALQVYVTWNSRPVEQRKLRLCHSSVLTNRRMWHARASYS